MRAPTFIIAFLSVCIAASYYVSYGRFHNSPIQQTKITYQPTLEPTSVPKPIAYTGKGVNPTQKKIVSTGQCANLPAKKDVMKMYRQDKGKDCGALVDNEALVDEGNSKSVLKCLQEGLKTGTCSHHKVYIVVQGFEGIAETLVTTKDCQVLVDQWATFEPDCGFVTYSCAAISHRFPFTVCDSNN